MENQNPHIKNFELYLRIQPKENRNSISLRQKNIGLSYKNNIEDNIWCIWEHNLYLVKTTYINWMLQTVGPWATSGTQLCFIWSTHYFRKILIGNEHLKTRSIHIKIQIFSSFEKKNLAALGLYFCKVSTGGSRLVEDQLPGCVFSRWTSFHHSLLPYDWSVSLIFVTRPGLLVFWACSSTRSSVPILLPSCGYAFL